MYYNNSYKMINSSYNDNDITKVIVILRIIIITMGTIIMPIIKLTSMEAMDINDDQTNDSNHDHTNNINYYSVTIRHYNQ